jgi:N-acetylmuramoyl-L-alanine amidase
LKEKSFSQICRVKFSQIFSIAGSTAFLWLFLWPGSMVFGQKPATTPQPNFLEIKPWPKADAPALLERYGLYDFECNMTQFLKINNLREEYKLKPNRLYKLPISVYVYNGKNIRTSVGIEDFKTALKIDKYNKEMQRLGVRSDDFKVSKLLWVPWHLQHCTTPGAPEKVPTNAIKSDIKEEPEPLNLDLDALIEKDAGKDSRVFPVFGKKYEKTPLLSRRLSGQVFYVVSGHGGPDVGAQGKRAGKTLCEDEYAYDVSLRLLRLLVSHGATAYMIVRDPNDGIRDTPFLACDKDESVWGNLTIPKSQKARLSQRSELINGLTERHQKVKAKKQTFIEIHVDSRSQLQRTDVFFYYRPDSEQSMQLAERLHRLFMEKYRRSQGGRLYGGTVTPRALHMLRETIVPRAVYVELGNIRNAWDQQRLVLPNNRQALANWLFLGISQ